MSGAVYKLNDQEFSADQLVALGADNPDLFYQLFFPRTVRQASAPFHLEMDQVLEDPNARLVELLMFRGSAKTTRLRMYTGRRVAYGLSRTILYVGASEGHAVRSIRWLRNQVERNKVFSGVFGLRAGAKWKDEEIEIVNETTGMTCWILGAGITGNIRGINFDDYRPDLILLDDVVTDENAATQEQRNKTFELIDGALRGSLAPATEEANAKMVVLQTPMHEDDPAMRISRSKQWTTLAVPCWTPETLDLPIAQQESAWPQRLPSETLRADKQAAAEDNRLFTWVRENEVRLTAREEAAFKSEWLRVLDIMPNPKSTFNVLAIDPLPPPSDREIAKGFVGKDFEVIGALGMREGNYFIHEYEMMQGHEPNWTVAKVFELAAKYQIVKIVISAVAYEKTLKWILEKEMARKKVWYAVELVTDKRPKYNRIVSTLSGVASQGRLHCHTTHTDLISQFNQYPSVKHDDILDMVATGLGRLINPVLEQGVENYQATMLNSRRYKVPRLRSAP